MKSTRLNHKKLYLLGLVTMASFMVSTSSAMEQIDPSSKDVLASLPISKEDFDPSNFARYQLALPNMEAQKNIPLEIKLAMGLKPGQPVPIRPQYGINGVTLKTMKEYDLGTPYDKSVYLKDGKLRSNFFNRIGEDENADTSLPDGVYLFGIDEGLNMRALPNNGESSLLSLESNSFSKRATENYSFLAKKANLGARLFSHFDLFSQKNLLVSGEIHIKNGQIFYINNSSGHYMPSSWHVYYGIRPYYLKNKEAFVQDFAVETVGSPLLSWQDFLNKKPWEAECKNNFAQVIEYLCENKDHFSIENISFFINNKVGTTRESVIEKAKQNLIEKGKITLEQSILASPFKKDSFEEDIRKRQVGVDIGFNDSQIKDYQSKIKQCKSELDTLRDKGNKMFKVFQTQDDWEYNQELEKEYNSLINEFIAKPAASYKEKQEKYARRFKDIPEEKRIDVLREIVGQKMNLQASRLSMGRFLRGNPELVKEKIKAVRDRIQQKKLLVA